MTRTRADRHRQRARRKKRAERMKRAMSWLNVIHGKIRSCGCALCKPWKHGWTKDGHRRPDPQQAREEES